MNIPTKSTNIIDSPLGGTEKDLLGVSDYCTKSFSFICQYAYHNSHSGGMGFR